MTTQNALNTQLVLPTGSTAINSLLYTSAANVVSGLASANNGILLTSNTGVPSIATTFGSGLSVTGSQLIVGLGSNIPFSQGFGIQDSAGLKELVFNVAVSAVNYFTMGNAATGVNPSLLATGTDSNIGISLLSKGTSGIVMTGVSDASSVAAGFVGEIVSSVIASGSAVSFTTATPKTLTSISLTAGDWDIWGNIWGTGATYIQTVQGGINTTTNVLPDISLQNYLAVPASVSGQLAAPVPQIRVTISATTTYYIVASFQGVGALTGVGGIYARRRR